MHNDFIILKKLAGNGTSQVLVATDAIILAERTIDSRDGLHAEVTRVIIGDSFETAIQIQEPISKLAEFINIVDLRGAYNDAGSSCDNANTLDVLEVTGVFPHILTRRYVDNIASQTVEISLNPKFILYAEEVAYIGSPNPGAVGTLVVLKGQQQRRLMTTLTIQELTSALNAKLVS